MRVSLVWHPMLPILWDYKNKKMNIGDLIRVTRDTSMRGGYNVPEEDAIGMIFDFTTIWECPYMFYYDRPYAVVLFHYLSNRTFKYALDDLEVVSESRRCGKN